MHRALVSGSPTCDYGNRDFAEFLLSTRFWHGYPGRCLYELGRGFIVKVHLDIASKRGDVVHPEERQREKNWKWLSKIRLLACTSLANV